MINEIKAPRVHADASVEACTEATRSAEAILLTLAYLSLLGTIGIDLALDLYTCKLEMIDRDRC